MQRSADGSSQWILYLTAGLLFAATVLRSLLIYRDSPALTLIGGLLLVWLILFVGETAIASRWRAYFPIYLILQTLLVLALLFMPDSPDYFAVLFCVLSMQIMQRANPGIGAACVGLFTPLIALSLIRTYDPSEGIALALIFTAGNVLLASYALAARRAQSARAQNQTLAQRRREANDQLQLAATQQEKLAAARERNRLARELHDSVTQTIFSMTLTTQSALLLLERDPSRVEAQLDRLNQLAQGALSEIRLLISELSAEKIQGGLVAALRQPLADRQFPENLAVTLQVEDDQPLPPAEEQVLFRIAQEALNNIVKHAHASQARVRLRLVEPMEMEIEDDGCGFDPQRAPKRDQVGLVSMRERAAEIGWRVQVISSPGAGARIRVDKPAKEEA